MMGAEVAVPPAAAAAAAARRSAFFALPANMLVLAAEFLMYSCGRAPNTRRRTSCCSCMPTAPGTTTKVRGCCAPGRREFRKTGTRLHSTPCRDVAVTWAHPRPAC